jgi:hypothetical protein
MTMQPLQSNGWKSIEILARRKQTTIVIDWKTINPKPEAMPQPQATPQPQTKRPPQSKPQPQQ